MPIYEYVSDQDGTIIELLRPMSQADAPVQDPDGKGRVFRRKQSAFSASSSGSPTGKSLPQAGGCCPCGKNAGSCRSS